MKIKKPSTQPWRELSALAAALALALAASPNAVALTINSPGVVGIHNGELANSNVNTERTAAQTLLNMAANTTVGNFQTSMTEYAGAPTNVLVGGTQTNTSVSGWEWGLGKYDGQNGGYVLFFLNGALASTLVPQTSETIWTNPAGQGFGLSHLTVFNQSGDIPGVPDGGSTVALFGLGLVLLAMVRRRFARD